MRLAEIDEHTQGTFFRCLHDEIPEDPNVIQARRRWYRIHREQGLRAKVLIADNGDVVGLCQYIPIEHSPFEGSDLLSVLCIWIHGYDHLVGNQQGRGYGRFVLGEIERDARENGFKGVTAWGKDFPHWNPVSFYEHMGYQRAATAGWDVLVWKPFVPDARPPRFMEPKTHPAVGDEKVCVTAFASGWCNGGIESCLLARQAASELTDIVEYTEVDASDTETMRSHGISDGLFVDGEPFRPDGPPFSAEELRAELIERHRQKNASYKRYLKADQTDWLLEEENPSVRYFALKELLDRPEDAPDVKQAKKDILASALVQRLLAHQEPGGYWGDANQYRSGVMYHGTAWRFMLLADLGLDGTDERIRRTAEYLMNRAQDAQHGGFGSHYEQDGRLGNFIPCFNGMMLWTYIRFGYFDDPRVQKNLRWVLEHARFDDGKVLNPSDWMIREGKMGDDGCWGRHSCIRGVGPTLQALSEIPESKRTEEVQSVLSHGIEFVLKHHVYKKSHNLEKPMNRRMIQLGFPNFGSGDMLDFLLVLTREGIQDERMDDAIRYLIRKQDRNGRWKMQRSFNDRLVVPIEEKGKPSKWITLRAMIVLKRHFECQDRDRGVSLF